MTEATSPSGPREPIPDEQLTPEQRAHLAKLRGIGSAINSTLAERGIDDVMVYSIQFGPRPETEAPSTTDIDGPTVFAEPIRPEPEPIGMPPPGGCYCTDCDDQGRCWSYCC